MSELIFGCPAEDCGRKFPTQAKLRTHISYRHPELITKEKNNNNLNDLVDHIKSLENFVEKEEKLREPFEMPKLPNYDKMLDELSEDENDNIKEIDKIDKEIKNEGEIIEITDELIGISNKYENYEDIKELNLSKKNIATFMTKRNVDFSEIVNLMKIDLSYNNISFSYDLRLFSKLQICIINNNHIQDIGFCELCPCLVELNAENNELTSITSLNKCKKNLQILKISHNNIQYKNSTLQTLQNLKNVKELTIEDNPFLSEIFGYKHLFITRYSNIKKLNGTEITDVDRDVSKRFVKENAIKARPNTAMPREAEIEENMLADFSANRTLSEFHTGTSIITKTGYVPHNQNETDENMSKKRKKLLPQLDTSKKQICDLQKENKYLRETIKKQQDEIDSLKLQIENMTILYADLEKKTKFPNIKENEQNVDNDEEKIRLKSQLEMWKKEYCDLLDKTMSTNTNTNSNEILRSNFSRSRPMTASTPFRSGDFEKVIKEISIMNRKNSLDDSLSDESNEDNDKNIHEEKLKENLKEIEDEINDDNDNEEIENKENKEDKEDKEVDDDSFGDIEEMCRKSFADLKSMREEIHSLNEKLPEKKVIKEIKTQPIKTTNVLAGRPVIIKKQTNMKANTFIPLVNKPISNREKDTKILTKKLK